MSKYESKDTFHKLFSKRDKEAFWHHDDVYNAEGDRVRLNTIEIAALTGLPHRKIKTFARKVLLNLSSSAEEDREILSEHAERMGRVNALSLASHELKFRSSSAFKSMADYLTPEQTAAVMNAWRKKSAESQAPSPRPVAVSIFLSMVRIGYVASSSEAEMMRRAIDAVEETTAVPMSDEELALALRAKAEIEAKHVPLCFDALALFMRMTDSSHAKK
ncbi:hypothetical protein [Pararobbsia alpina]|uniref:Uncharacterized protein n=1 Tax=Pararobbsia alpina TaxID=621374 RepID=A0A6S7B973_9BURK|nr:hypothetical protein [Pararobbsia alpina]CAB3783340.1 hypothetical protein LMG28138_01620 [Pararobbsia alpina]